LPERCRAERGCGHRAGTDVGPSRNHQRKHSDDPLVRVAAARRPLGRRRRRGARRGRAAVPPSDPGAGRDLRAAAPTSSLAGTTQAPAFRNHPSSGAGIDVAPLAGGLTAVAAAFAAGAGVTLRRRQARTLA